MEGAKGRGTFEHRLKGAPRSCLIESHLLFPSNEMGVPPALPGRHAKFDRSGSMFLFAHGPFGWMGGSQWMLLTLSVAIRPL